MQLSLLIRLLANHYNCTTSKIRIALWKGEILIFNKKTLYNFYIDIIDNPKLIMTAINRNIANGEIAVISKNKYSIWTDIFIIK